jgi:hypothetical protein
LLKLYGQAHYDAAVEFDHNLPERPIDFLLEAIQCHDKSSGTIMEYTVANCGTSALSSECVVLQDEKGGKEQITTQEFFEIQV